MNTPFDYLRRACLLILLSAAVACLCERLWAQISIGIANDQVQEWTSTKTVPLPDGNIWTEQGRFGDVQITNRVRIQVMSVNGGTNGISSSTNLTEQWAVVRPPGYAYSPNVVRVGPPEGVRFFAQAPPLPPEIPPQVIEQGRAKTRNNAAREARRLEVERAAAAAKAESDRVTQKAIAVAKANWAEVEQIRAREKQKDTQKRREWLVAPRQKAGR